MTMHRLNTANAADLFEGRRPEERTLIDFCRTPFSFGLVLLIPVAVMLYGFISGMQSQSVPRQILKSLESPFNLEALNR